MISETTYRACDKFFIRQNPRRRKDIILQTCQTARKQTRDLGT